MCISLEPFELPHNGHTALGLQPPLAPSSSGVAEVHPADTAARSGSSTALRWSRRHTCARLVALVALVGADLLIPTAELYSRVSREPNSIMHGEALEENFRACLQAVGSSGQWPARTTVRSRRSLAYEKPWARATQGLRVPSCAWRITMQKLIALHNHSTMLLACRCSARSKDIGHARVLDPRGALGWISGAAKLTIGLAHHLLQGVLHQDYHRPPPTRSSPPCSRTPALSGDHISNSQLIFSSSIAGLAAASSYLCHFCITTPSLFFDTSDTFDHPFSGPTPDTRLTPSLL